jgi:hypothetical protein
MTPAVIALILTAALGFMGAYVTLYPISDALRLFWLAGFGGVAVASLLFGIWALVSSHSDDETRQKKLLEAIVGGDQPPYITTSDRTDANGKWIESYAVLVVPGDAPLQKVTLELIETTTDKPGSINRLSADFVYPGQNPIAHWPMHPAKYTAFIRTRGGQFVESLELSLKDGALVRTLSVSRIEKEKFIPVPIAG